MYVNKQLAEKNQTSSSSVSGMSLIFHVKLTSCVVRTDQPVERAASSPV